MKDHKKPLNRSITIGCVLFIILLCVLLSAANMSIYRNYVYDDYRNYIRHILDLTMSQIDGEDLKNCIETGEESQKFKETLAYMDNLMDNFPDIHYLYAVRPLNSNETGNVMSVLSAERYYDRHIDTEGNLYLGWVSDDEFDAATASKFMEIMQGNDIVYFEEKTEWGTDYTGARPIKDDSGKGIAVLAVDVDISFIDKMIRQYAFINIGIIALMGIVFIGLFLIWSQRNITKPIRRLEESAVGFVDRSHGRRDIDALEFDAPKLERDNEIKSLSDAVTKMTENMRDYAKDIISAEKEAASMKKLATRDALTGIRNKTAYDDEKKRIEDSIRSGDTKYGLAVIDLNSLKHINDTYGHDKGDLAIIKLCRMICNVFKHSAVFRIGGDEFVVILQGSDYDDHDMLIKSFLEETAKTANDDSLEPWDRISAAVGTAMYDESLDDGIDSMFKRADKEMYDCKKSMKASV